jgi:hypothetical protein
MLDLKQLRQLAEVAVYGKDHNYYAAVHPAAIVELLDLVDELAAECARLKLGWDASHKNYVKAVTRD